MVFVAWGMAVDSKKDEIESVFHSASTDFLCNGNAFEKSTLQGQGLWDFTSSMARQANLMWSGAVNKSKIVKYIAISRLGQEIKDTALVKALWFMCWATVLG